MKQTDSHLDDRDRQDIVDYLASEAPHERVTHLEKLKTERVLGRKLDAWDVHTATNRWWVITEPTNLYPQAQFPSLEIAISFHVGLMARAEARQARTARPEQAVRFARAWRSWEQAGEAMEGADEAEEFQAVGMRCREALIAFVQQASESVKSPEAPPKRSDYVGWSSILADVLASGKSQERKRGYLKGGAKDTWELANWLTHARDATSFDAFLCFDATRHTLSTWSVVFMRRELNVPDRCPSCASYQLSTFSRPTRSRSVNQFTICEACGWRSKPHRRKPISPISRTSAAPVDPSECVVVSTPLAGPKPPEPTRRKRPR